MKKILLFLISIALFASCAEKEEPVTDIALTVAVTDGGFVMSDGSTVYSTAFEAGDRIGLFAVRDGAIVAGMENLCLTASGSAGSLVWQAADPEMTYPSDATYFAYYPHTDNLPAEVVPAGKTPEDFFAQVISAWDVQLDQSGDGYASSDLLVAASSPSDGRLDMDMSHVMSLLMIELPGTVYRFTNTDYQIPDYSLSSAVSFNEGIVPVFEGSRYLYIIKPGSYSLSGNYVADRNTVDWACSGNAVSGEAYLHSEGESIVIEHLLQTGDFFLADGTLLSKDESASVVGAADVIGIVCQIDPERIADGEREALGGVAHALVLATRNAGNGGLYRFYTDYAIWETDFENSFVRDETEIGFPEVPQETNLDKLCELADANLGGYEATHLIYTERAEDLAAGNYPGFKAVYDFAAEVGGPVDGLTTGWFMPSGGQYLDAIRNLCGVTLTAAEVSESGNKEGTMTWFDNGLLSQTINATMEKVAPRCKTLYYDYQNATMVSVTAAPDLHRYIDLADGGWVDYLCAWKYTTSMVRPMLAF